MTPKELRTRMERICTFDMDNLPSDDEIAEYGEMHSKALPALIDLWEAVKNSTFTFRDCDCPSCKRVVETIEKLEEL